MAVVFLKSIKAAKTPKRNSPPHMLSAVVQSMNILIVNQSVIDLCASFFTTLTASVEVDGTHMSRSSVYDQFVCRTWLTRIPLWAFLVTSTYGIVLAALERYTAVIHPIWYKVRAGSFYPCDAALSRYCCAPVCVYPSGFLVAFTNRWAYGIKTAARMELVLA